MKKSDLILVSIFIIMILILFFVIFNASNQKNNNFASDDLTLGSNGGSNFNENMTYVELTKSNSTEEIRDNKINQNEAVINNCTAKFIENKEILIMKEENCEFLFETGDTEGFLEVPLWGFDKENIIKSFYSEQKDNYDFILVFPMRSITTSSHAVVNREENTTGAYPLKNKFTKRLKSIIWIDEFFSFNYTRANNLNAPSPSSMSETIMHEIAHHWCCSGESPYGFIGKSHWKSNLDLFEGDLLKTDLMSYYGPWVLKEGDRICIQKNNEGVESSFSKLSLFMMGLIPASEVPKISLHLYEKNGDDRFNIIGPDCSYNSSIFTNTEEISIQNIMDSTSSVDWDKHLNDEHQKDFNVLFLIIMQKDQQIDQGFIDVVRNHKEDLPDAWNQATSGKSKINVY